jgi:hypothetical protein
MGRKRKLIATAIRPLQKKGKATSVLYAFKGLDCGVGPKLLREGPSFSSRLHAPFFTF